MEIIIPSPGESISEVVLEKWLKNEGDYIKKNEDIAEIETEKANLNIAAEKEGILKIKVAAGSEVKVGAVIGEIVDSTEQTSKADVVDKEKEKQGTSKIEVEKQETLSLLSENKNLKQESLDLNKANTNNKDTSAEKFRFFDVIIPSPGESINEVQIGAWLKKDGDFVKKDEPILEIESEKASLTINAEMAGILNIKMKEGHTTQVGDIAAIIKESSTDPKAESKPKTQDKKASDINKEITSITKEDVTEIISNEELAGKSTLNNDVSIKQNNTKENIIASPAATKMMEAKNIKLEQGTGKGGRITKTDVIQLLTSEEQTSEKKFNVAEFIQSKSDLTQQPAVEEKMVQRKLDVNFADSKNKVREVTKNKLSNLRKKISAKLVEVNQTTASLTTFNEVNMGAIKKARLEYKEQFSEAYGIKLGFLSFFAKACCLALKEFHGLNSQLDKNQEYLLTPNYVDLGIAVSTEKGLMVPVIKDADRLSLAAIEKEIVSLANKARSGKIQVTEMIGGTFTITNGGIFGSMLSTPILNPPQSGILGMHKIEPRATVINNKIEIADIMYLALTYDHRIVDGKEAVSFLVTVKDYLENPIRMLLEI